MLGRVGDDPNLRRFAAGQIGGETRLEHDCLLRLSILKQRFDIRWIATMDTVRKTPADFYRFRTASVVSRTADSNRCFRMDRRSRRSCSSRALPPIWPAANRRRSDRHRRDRAEYREPLQAYAQAVIDGYQRELSASATPSGVRASRIVIAPDVRVRFNPTRASSNLFVPGLMAFVLTIVSSMMTAISLTREKETGTMEAMLVSPLRPLEIIVGKVAPYLVIGFVSVIAIFVEARLVFRVPLRGSVRCCCSRPRSSFWCRSRSASWSRRAPRHSAWR